MKKVFIILVLSLVLTCASDDSDSNNRALIIGEWELVSCDDPTASVEELYLIFYSFGRLDVIIVDEDGNDIQQEFTWLIDNDLLRVSNLTAGTPEEFLSFGFESEDEFWTEDEDGIRDCFIRI